jgi:sec-independent protein translocase protein TatB
MFNIGAGEFIALGVIALFLIGPDRLPHVARDAAKWIKRFKEIANNATSELKDSLGPEFQDLEVGDLRPKNFIKKTIGNALDEANPTEEIKEIGKSAKIDPDLL